jgi:hypothetical protein
VRSVRLALVLATVTGGSLVVASAATMEVDDDGAPLQVIHQPAEGITTSTSSTTTSSTSSTTSTTIDELVDDAADEDLLVDEPAP